MSIITDKLDADWADKEIKENVFTVRAVVENMYNVLNEAISGGGDSYPTGDSAVDAYVVPIIQEMVTFKNGLENNYAEFINWKP
jgi:hypothetical protein